MFSLPHLGPFESWAFPNQKTKPTCMPCWPQAWALASVQCPLQECTLPCPEHIWSRAGGPQVSPQSLTAGLVLPVLSLSGSWCLYIFPSIQNGIKAHSRQLRATTLNPLAHLLCQAPHPTLSGLLSFVFSFPCLWPQSCLLLVISCTRCSIFQSPCHLATPSYCITTVGARGKGKKGSTLFETLTSFSRAAESHSLQPSTADRIGGHFPQDSDFSLLSPQLPGKVEAGAALQQDEGLAVIWLHFSKYLWCSFPCV